MKILHTHSGNLYGGVETLLVTLARESGAAADVESHFALCFDGRLSTELTGAGATVHSIGEVRLSRPWSVARARRLLRDLAQRHAYDAIVCHSLWPQTVFGPAVRAEGIPLVFWLHDAASGGGWLRRWAGRTKPDLVVCNSRFTAGTLPALYRDVRSELIHYPITLPDVGREPAQIATLREALGTAPDAVVIIQVSRMEAWKGHVHHLEALGKLRDVAGWVCWQVGGAQRPEEREYMDSLRDLAVRLGIADRVVFLGQRADVPGLLAAADIHCQPNAEPEPFGITFIEALNSGLPVVSFDMGGASEIVDESCGVLVPAANTDALAAALRRLIDDGGERVRLGAAGPARARAFCDPGQQIEKLRMALSSVQRG